MRQMEIVDSEVAIVLLVLKNGENNDGDVQCAEGQ